MKHVEWSEMPMKAKMGILSTLLLVSVLGIAINSMPKAAPDTTIQAAINAASDGDSVLVEAGTYRENVVVNKTLTLIGAGSNTTFIEGNRTEPVITIAANDVTLKGFTIQKGGAEGVYISGFNQSTISDNVIISNEAEGIYLDSSNGSTIVGNMISLNRVDGISLDNSHDNVISNNVISKNRLGGLGLLNSDNNRIINNIISFHNVTPGADGIWLEDSSYNLFEGNKILNNDSGIDIISSDNIFYHNNLINNTYHQVDTLGATNAWDNGTVGNYWSDYEERYPDAKEINGSGIWNISYVIDENNQDRHPLINPWSPPKDVTPPITVDDYDGSWYTADFTINLKAADDLSGVNETYYRINDTPSISNVSADGQPFITTERTNNTLEYWSIDFAGNDETHHNLTDIKLDKTAPDGSILINDGDAYTTSPLVTLNLSATDAISGVSQMRFSNDGIVWSPWETYCTSNAWNVTLEDGVKTIYVQYVDNARLLSQSYHDTIVLDTTAPTVSILSPSPGSEVKLSKVTIDWNGTDAGSGIDYYEVRLDVGSWENVGTKQTYAFTELSDGSHTVDVKAIDKIGRSAEVSVSFVVNTSPIGGPGYIEEVALIVIVAAALGFVLFYIFKIRK